MTKQHRRSYKSFRREFRMLRAGGCRLYYPGEREIGPRELAKTISGDADATYMRDAVYDRKGRLVKVHFTRVVID